MTDIEFDPEESERFARDAAARLIRLIEAPDPTVETVRGLADVEADVGTFGAQYRTWRALGMDMPCLVDEAGEAPPLPLNLLPYAALTPLQPELMAWFGEWSRFQAPALEASTRLLYREYPPGAAAEFFQTRLGDFLRARFNGWRSGSGRSILPGWLQRHAPVSPARLAFRVHARQHGLRVHYSPAYFFTPDRVFGAPTSPVDGRITPGRYIFGVAGPGLSPQFDRGEYDIPPATEAHLMVP